LCYDNNYMKYVWQYPLQVTAFRNDVIKYTMLSNLYEIMNTKALYTCTRVT